MGGIVIQSIIFDMDGLMLDTEPISRTAWQNALNDLNYSLDNDTYLTLLGRTIEDTHMLLCDHFGLGLPFSEVFKLRQSYIETYYQQHEIPHKAGITELLDFLEMHHINKAIATSSPCKSAKYKLHKAGLSHYFTTLIGGDQVQHGKPAPDLFIEAAKQINANPNHCVVLEDSEAGIQAAFAAGMIPIMVPDIEQPAPEIANKAYRIFPSLHEVRLFLSTEIA